jgi:HSP20 family protein
MKGETRLPSLWSRRKGEIDPFWDFRSRLDDLFSDWAGEVRSGTAPANGVLSLRVDVSETPADVTVKADLPGVEQKDIDITVAGDQLTIKAEKKSEVEENRDNKGHVFHRVERTFGSFQRTMTMPFDIDPQKVSASFKNGILTVSVAKPADSPRQVKKIQVKAAA